MSVLAQTQDLLAPWLMPVAGDRPKVAIVLNGCARAVSDRAVAELKESLRDETLYVSSSFEQSEFIARNIVNRGYDVVLCGGGDGTFSRVVSDVLALGPARVPLFGVLRFGTGNALADALGVGPRGVAQQVEELRRASASQQRVDLPMLRIDGRLAPFAGLGLDALILQDYNTVKGAMGRTPLRALGSGAMGYGLAIATRSLWRVVGRPLPQVTVRNEGAPVRRLDADGRPVGTPVRHGEIVYRGPASIAAASTIPFYGFGLRLFPHADRLSRRFQLRVGRVNPVDVLAHLPSLFAGTYASDELWDFSCTAVSIHSEEPTPMQVGGDLVGLRQEMLIGLQQIEALPGSRAQGEGEPVRVARDQPRISLAS